MADKNDITGDSLVSKPTSEEFKTGWDRIWGSKEKEVVPEDEELDSNIGC